MGSKLKEKAARMPDIRQPEIEEAISRYVEEVEGLPSEPARAARFLMLLKDLFGVEPQFVEEVLRGMEAHIGKRRKGLVLRGRPDFLFGNLVVEFEKDLTKADEKEEALSQLKKYVAILWSQEGRERRPYLCVATDGLTFFLLTPSAPEKEEVSPEEVELSQFERLDLREVPPYEAYFWLDRHLCRREILPPRTEEIVKDFGPDSHAFRTVKVLLDRAWEALKGGAEFEVIYQSWAKYLRITYGGPVADPEELFIRHTYLATFAKLLCWARLAEPKERPSDDLIVKVLDGSFFKKRGIENLLEEDFFAWLVREAAREAGLRAARFMLSLLQNYNLREISEDVLKSLYEKLVDPKDRHDLGEFYTPDWLAHRMVASLLEGNPEASVLDPACGSGTFLYMAIREKRRLLGDSPQTLRHILDSVVGVDIHPLAAIVARTNYILALGDLIRRRRGRISIPVYLADSIRLPEREMVISTPAYRIALEGRQVWLPERLAQDPSLYDEAVEAAREFALQTASQKAVAEEQFLRFLQVRHRRIASDEETAKALFRTASTLRNFIRERRDTIWAFVLKNVFKPLFLKGKFDIVLGNPPWLSYRYVERGEYQEFLKRQIVENYGLLSGRAELITHMELGTLFFLRAADLYLKPGGRIAFVLPKSIFSADQHDALRRAKFGKPPLTLEEVWDLEDVEPLFNVPACVLFARKGEEGFPSPVERLKCLRFSGRLERKNVSLPEAEEALSVRETWLVVAKSGKRTFWADERAVAPAKEKSPYAERFKEGATIVPRSLWFVEVVPSPLGFDPELPLLRSAKHALKMAKGPYRDLVMEGSVEAQFLYGTLLSTDLLPFGHLPFRLVVLPILPKGDSYELLSPEEARRLGFLGLAQWLERAQEEWERRRAEKADRMSVLERLDYQRGLSSQNPKARYRVLYPMSATYLCACVVGQEPLLFEIEEQVIKGSNFLADCKTFFIETDDEGEAFYLAAALNAPLIDQLVKPLQSRGLFGPRHICKKIFDIAPIPEFDPENDDHVRLSKLGEECTKKVRKLVRKWLRKRLRKRLDAGGAEGVESIGALRRRVRKLLRDELRKIDELVRRIL